MLLLLYCLCRIKLTYKHLNEPEANNVNPLYEHIELSQYLIKLMTNVIFRDFVLVEIK